MGGFFGSGLGGGSDNFDPTALGGIPTTDSGINIAGNSSLLDSLTNLATGIGSSVSGVINSINNGNPAVLSQQNAVPLAQASGSGLMLIALGVGAYFLIKRKR